MLTRDLQSQTIPYLHLHDTVYQALQMMNDFHVVHLPIIDDERKYLGIISEDELLHAEDDTLELKAVKDVFSNPSVKDDEHFLKAIQVAVQNKLSIVPVVEEDSIIMGAVTYSDLLRYASDFMSLHEPGGLIVIELNSKDYSFNEISRIVEANDAQITQLNTYVDPNTGIMQLTIKINKLEISDIISTLQRYEYNVRYYFGEELYENELKTNYDNLMNYLKI
jgi:acetoin utilization protein AcuB